MFIIMQRKYGNNTEVIKCVNESPQQLHIYKLIIFKYK